MNVNLDITEKQSDFLQSEAWGTIFHAGIGSGKSLVLCRKALMCAMNKQRYCIVSFSYRMLKDVIIDLLY